MTDFTKILETVKKHEEKYPGINYVTFPDKFLQRLNVLTKKGEDLLANEGALGTYRVQRLSIALQKIIDHQKPETKIDWDQWKDDIEFAKQTMEEVGMLPYDN